MGEAFRSLVPAAVVWLSYGVSSSYVLADAIDKGKKARDVSVNLPRDPSPWPAPPCGQSTALHMVKSLIGQSTSHSLAWHTLYPLLCRVVTPAPSPVGDIVYTLVVDVSPHSALNWYSPEPNANVALSPTPTSLPSPWSSLMPLVHRVSRLCPCWIKCLLCPPGTGP